MIFLISNAQPIHGQEIPRSSIYEKQYKQYWLGDELQNEVAATRFLYVCVNILFYWDERQRCDRQTPVEHLFTFVFCVSLSATLDISSTRKGCGCWHWRWVPARIYVWTVILGKDNNNIHLSISSAHTALFFTSVFIINNLSVIRDEH